LQGFFGHFGSSRHTSGVRRLESSGLFISS
jgi:hypothetical protein